MLTPRTVAPAVMALALLLPASRAADLDPYVPPDSEWVLHLNVKQLAAAPAVKKHAEERLGAAVRGGIGALKPLTDLGVDPLKDVATATAAGSGLLQMEKVLLIVRGDFDADKLRKAAEGLAKKEAAAWKVVKLGDVTLYEARDKARPLPTYLAVLADGTVLISSGKKYVAAAAAVDPRKPARASQGLQGLVAKADAKDDLWLASVMPKDVQRLLARSPQTAPIAEAVTAFTGRVKVGDDMKFAFNVPTKEKKAADEVAQLLDAAKGFASLRVQNVDGVGPLLSELIDACKTSTDGTTATLAGQLSEEQIAKALKKK
jgi:hypothetical protein